MREITGGKGVPVVYDFGRQGDLRGLAEVPAPARHNGVVRRVLGRSRSGVAAAPRPARLALLTHPSLIDYTATREELLETANDLFAMVASGKIRIEISKAYALKDAPRAHADLEERKTTGSIVLVV